MLPGLNVNHRDGVLQAQHGPLAWLEKDTRIYPQPIAQTQTWDIHNPLHKLRHGWQVPQKNVRLALYPRPPEGEAKAEKLKGQVSGLFMEMKFRMQVFLRNGPALCLKSALTATGAQLKTCDLACNGPYYIPVAPAYTIKPSHPQQQKP